MKACWETEIRDAARDFGLLHERKGRPPTAKQFATHAVAATNHWFGGDMSRLYSMIGEKSPIAPVLVASVPTDRQATAGAVLDQLTRRNGEAMVSRDMVEGTSSEQALWDRQRLAELSIAVLQLGEALGRPPSLAEFGHDQSKRPRS